MFDAVTIATIQCSWRNVMVVQRLAAVALLWGNLELQTEPNGLPCLVCNALGTMRGHQRICKLAHMPRKDVRTSSVVPHIAASGPVASAVVVGRPAGPAMLFFGSVRVSNSGLSIISLPRRALTAVSFSRRFTTGALERALLLSMDVVAAGIACDRSVSWALPAAVWFRSLRSPSQQLSALPRHWLR
jgi:hypothetical protein